MSRNRNGSGSAVVARVPVWHTCVQRDRAAIGCISNGLLSAAAAQQDDTLASGFSPSLGCRLRNSDRSDSVRFVGVPGDYLKISRSLAVLIPQRG